MVQKLKMPSDKTDIVHADLAAQKSNEFPDYDAILFHAGRLAITFKAKQEASKAHSKARAIFKSTGVSMTVFDLVDGIAEQDDPQASIDKFMREMVHIATAFAILPPGPQVDLFQGATSPLAAKDKAYAIGRARAVLGLSPDDQAYHVNSDLGQEHRRGWHDGQEVLQQKLLAMNRQFAAEEEAKKAVEDERAKKKAERQAKAEAKLPKTDSGETVQ